MTSLLPPDAEKYNSASPRNLSRAENQKFVVTMRIAINIQITRVFLQKT